jgi:hypothetical protein
MLEKVKTVLKSAPAVLAVVTAVATAVVTQVAPALPDSIAVRVVAVGTAVLSVVATLAKVVSLLTPVPDSIKGLEPKTTLDKAVAFSDDAWSEEGFDVDSGVF